MFISCLISCLECLLSVGSFPFSLIQSLFPVALGSFPFKQFFRNMVFYVSQLVQFLVQIKRVLSPTVGGCVLHQRKEPISEGLGFHPFLPDTNLCNGGHRNTVFKSLSVLCTQMQKDKP